MLRVIREVKPTWIVGENVLGLVNWSGGLVFEEVQADLEAEGYEVQPFVLPAASVNAPHRRDRVWFVAYRNGSRFQTSRTRQQTAGIEQYGELRRQPSEPSEVFGTAADTELQGFQGCGKSRKIPTQKGTLARKRYKLAANASTIHSKRTASDTDSNGLQRRCNSRELRNEGSGRNKRPKNMGGIPGANWENFPTESPLHKRDDGIPKKLAIFVVNEVRDAISKTSQENRIQNLQEVWERVQQEEIWEKIRRLYSLESKDLLFQAMQLYSTSSTNKGELSPFSEDVSKNPLRTLLKYGEFRRSPQGQELEKQRTEQFGNSLSFLPHEVALAARAYSDSIRKFETWHRQEAIKATGNAVVPQVVHQIFKAIQAYEDGNHDQSPEV